MFLKGDDEKENEARQRLLNAEGEWLLRWERVSHARSCMGSLQPDRINMRPKKTCILATDLLLAELDDLRTAVFEYREAQRAREYGS